MNINYHFLPSMLLLTALSATTVFAMEGAKTKTTETKICRECLPKGKTVQSKLFRNWTALHYACLYGHANCVAALINKDAILNAKTNLGETPLHLACSHGRSACTRLLLEKGADLTAQNQNGQTPLDLANQHKKYEVIQTIQVFLTQKK